MEDSQSFILIIIFFMMIIIIIVIIIHYEYVYYYYRNRDVKNRVEINTACFESTPELHQPTTETNASERLAANEVVEAFHFSLIFPTDRGSQNELTSMRIKRSCP